MQDVVLAAFLVVDDELHGDARAARPVGVRRRAPVADHVARIIVVVRHAVQSLVAALGRMPATLRHGAVCSNPANAPERAPPISPASMAPMTDISLSFEPPFARIVLNRPERRNAISRAMWRALPAIRTSIEAQPDALVVIVEGAGGHFSAGADISEFDEVYKDAAATRDYGDAIQDGLRALMEIDRPTIAVLQGNVVGGGLAVALACDLRFCAADAFLAVTPARLGLVYGHAETRRLVELVGPARAKDILFTGRRIETDEALSIGLIDRESRPRCARPCSVTLAAWPISARPRSAAASGRSTRSPAA